jgi:tetratricopeptide (TPR) repeat protein
MQLVTLGDLRLGGSSFHRRKPLLMLTYLTLEGPQDRRRLSQLLFPDTADPMASLRVALTRLRQAAPGAVHVDGSIVHSLVSCDAEPLLDDLAGSDLLGRDDAYPGPFLQGVDVEGISQELEEWVFSTRELLAERVRSALLGYADLLTRRGDLARAARAAHEALSVRGAGPAEPEQLARAHAIFVASDAPWSDATARELADYGIDPDDLPVPESEAAAESSRETPNNLVLPITSFVGRDDELKRIATLLRGDQDRLITLLGTAGVGKTRLSIQAAHEALGSDRFRDGVYWVGLDALTDPEQIPDQVAQALGLSIQANTPAIDQLIRFLEPKRLLLILDNFEQLIDGALIPARLVTQCRALTIAVTSRQRLGVREERTIRVEGLEIPPATTTDPAQALTFDAVRLFTLRAQHRDAAFRLDPDTLPDVLHICRLVDGAPLGLELAAAWTPALPVPDIAQELERGLGTLTARAKDVPDKHRSLEAAFETSWDLLDDPHRDVLRRLAVFRGGFRRDAAAEVAGATLPILADLVDRSLLRLAPDGRYDRHPLVHQFCLEKLAADAEERRTYEDRHGTYFWQQTRPPDDAVPSRSEGGRNLFERLETDLSPETLKRAQDEFPNLRAAWQHYLAAQDAAKIADVADFHGTVADVWNRFREGLVLFEDALASLGDDSDEQRLARARVEGVLAVVYWRLGRFTEGVRLAQAALDVVRELEAPEEGIGHWWATQAAGLNLQHLGRVHEALALVSLGHDHADRASKTTSSSFWRRRFDGLAGLSAAICGWCCIFLGDLERAEAWLMASHQRMYTSTPRGAAYANYPLAYLALVQGDPEGAIRWASEGIAHAEKVGHDVVILSILQRWGRALFALDRLDEAEAVLARAVQKAHLSGDLVDGTPSRALMGRVLVRLGRPTEAVPLLVRAIREARTIGQVPFSLDDALLGVAELAASADDPLASRIALLVAGLDGAQPIAHEEAKRLLERLPASEDGGHGDLDDLVRGIERFARRFGHTAST